MNKRERIWAAVHGEKTDILPYSFWTHLPGIDLDPEKLAEATYNFYKTYDVDFIKTMNNGMYAIEDFGCEIDYSEVLTGGIAKVVSTPIQTPDDWYNIKACSIHKGSLARELKGFQLLLDKIKEENVPVIFTIFSPLTIAAKLSGGKLRQHIEDGHADAIHYALRVITETTCNMTREVLNMGADGIFFAIQNANYDFMTPEKYQEYGVVYDLEVFQAAEKGWMNTIHAHGSNIMFEILRDYPAQVFNWHAWEALPAVDEAYALSGKCLMGGLDRRDITNCNRNEIQHQIYECYRLMKGQNQILTPGCVIRYPLNDDMLEYIKKCRDFTERKMRR